MGQTLDNGIYLPSEGERNCYEGLAGNWVALDNHLGSTNIHVTINDKQAWDGHVADTTIHVTSADKQTWNSHVADTTIHVTSADKQAWDGHVADSVKHVTAEDKAKWDAVTSKANDSNVVHNSGNETVGGKKTFTDEVTASKNATNGALNLQNLSYDPKTNGQSAIGSTKSFSINALTSTSDLFSAVSFYGASDKTFIRFTARYYTDSQNFDYDSIEYTLYGDGTRSFRPRNNNNTTLGESIRKWKSVYATNYYYGSNNVEFSTKFVTTDTNQSVSGQKVFTDINAISSSAEIGVSGGNNSFKILDKNKKTISRYEAGTFSGGMAYSYLLVNNGSDVFNGVSLYQSSANLAQLRPYSSTLSLQLGASTRSFSDCYTSKINGLTPSSLSLPSDRSARIDISSYITNLGNGDNNSYVVPANGYIWLHFTSINSALCYSQTPDGLTNYSQTFVRYQGNGQLYAFFPVRKDDKFVVQIYTSSTAVVQNAYFIPCQGNV